MVAAVVAAAAVAVTVASVSGDDAILLLVGAVVILLLLTPSPHRHRPSPFRPMLLLLQMLPARLQWSHRWLLLCRPLRRLPTPPPRLPSSDATYEGRRDQGGAVRAAEAQRTHSTVLREGSGHEECGESLRSRDDQKGERFMDGLPSALRANI